MSAWRQKQNSLETCIIGEKISIAEYLVTHMPQTIPPPSLARRVVSYVNQALVLLGDLEHFLDQVSSKNLNFMPNKALGIIWGSTTQHNGFLAPQKNALKAQFGLLGC